MSEHQIYEFVAVDRPLTTKEMAELRAISTRAEITSTRFWNEYHWGDLKADPRELLARYFDVHLYMASWGERRFMVRLPGERVDVAALRRYLGSRKDVLAEVDGHVILELASDCACDGYDEDDDDEVVMADTASLVGLRAGLLQGDLRVPYLGWLLGVQAGRSRDTTKGPPVPAGLGRLSGAFAALADFLGMDEDLLRAAGERSRVKGPTGGCTVGQLRARARELAEIGERRAQADMARMRRQLQKRLSESRVR